jgi:hypothetical protein
MKKRVLLALAFAFCLMPSLTAQDDLQELFDDDSPTTNFTIATFKTTRVVLGQSVELPPGGELIFVVSHHFGKINSGVKEFFGLDHSTVRLGLEYGLHDRIGLGIGRSSFNKMVDGSIKVNILKQQTGARNIPLTAVFYSTVNIRTSPWVNTPAERDFLFAHRIAYAHQLLMARKFNANLSLQITPTLVHFNLVPLKTDHNSIPAVGVGGRYKILPRLTLNGEYFYIPSKFRFEGADPSLSVGFDLETGGHVFQLFLTNSYPIYDPGFIAETYGEWSKGDVYFGFNITRVFTLR